MNMKNIIFILSIILILILNSACGPVVAPETETLTQDSSVITSIANTAQAGVIGTLTQIALDLPSDTPPTFTTLTPEQTVSPLPSPTSSKPMISVEVETLCRLGPGKVYDRVGELGIGKLVEVFGLDPSSDYYLIRNPSHPENFCWVWGFYATPVNNIAGLPVYTPMHTPTLLYTSTPTIVTPPSTCALVSQNPANNIVLKPGTDFDGTWTLKNIGTAAWLSTKVDLKFIGSVNGKFHKPTFPDLSDLLSDVAKDGTVKIIVDMIAPAANGTYTENWALVQGATTLCSMTLTIVVKP